MSSASPRILFVSDSPGGGAGVAALRLYEELKKAGLEVRFLVFRDPSGPTAGWNTPLDIDRNQGMIRKGRKLVGWVKEAVATWGRWRRAGKRDRFFGGRPDGFEITTIFPGRTRLEDHPWFAWAQIVHVHWAAGFLAPRQQWSAKQWVISLHDANPFTAVCHFPGDCTLFETGCQVCPQLAATRNPRWSGRVFLAKQAGYQGADRVTVHSPSEWIARLSKRSLLTKNLSTVVLPNLVPTEVFRRLDAQVCRNLLNLPLDRSLGLFVAGSVTNVRKGFSWFLRLAEALVGTEWEFLIVGGGELPSLPSNCRVLGRLGDPRLMAAAYNAADLFVSTALQDNFPSTVLESQFCGTPVIGFAVGGQSEMIVPQVTGYLAQEVGLVGLVAGIDWYQKALPSKDSVADSAALRWNQKTLLDQWAGFYRGLR